MYIILYFKYYSEMTIAEIKTLFKFFNDGCIIIDKELIEYYKYKYSKSGHKTAVFHRIETLCKINNNADGFPSSGHYYPKPPNKHVAQMRINRGEHMIARREAYLNKRRRLAPKLRPKRYGESEDESDESDERAESDESDESEDEVNIDPRGNYNANESDDESDDESNDEPVNLKLLKIKSTMKQRAKSNPHHYNDRNSDSSDEELAKMKQYPGSDDDDDAKPVKSKQLK